MGETTDAQAPVPDDHRACMLPAAAPNPVPDLRLDGEAEVWASARSSRLTAAGCALEWRTMPPLSTTRSRCADSTSGTRSRHASPLVPPASASGKTTVADALAERCGFARVSSDLVRKHRAGLAPTEHAPATRYDDRTNRDTYAALGEQARALASSGVIVDATFRRRTDREWFFLALGAGVPVLVIECRVPLYVLEQRAMARQRDPGNVSDADRAVVLAQVAAFDALDAMPAGRHAI